MPYGIVGRVCWLLALVAAASAPANPRKVVIAFGDSTTAPRHGVVVYSHLLRRELNSTVVNAGIPGNTTEDARKRFQKDVLARSPDVVIIQFGINDAAVDVWKKPPATKPRAPLARYRANLAYFVRTLRKHHSKVILMTPNPQCWTDVTRKYYGKPPYQPGKSDGMDVFLRNYVQAVREIAATQHVPLVDVYKIFSARGPSRCSLLLDGMHPNSRGHRIITSHLLPFIKAALSTRNRAGGADSDF